MPTQRTKAANKSDIRNPKSEILSHLPFVPIVAPLAVIVLTLFLGRDIYNRYLATFYHRQYDILNEELSTSNPSLRRSESISRQIQFLRRAISLDPDNAVLPSSLATLCEHIGDDAQLLISLQSDLSSLLRYPIPSSRASQEQVFSAAEDSRLLGPSDFLLFALNGYRNAIQRDPADAIYHAKLARVYTKLAPLGGLMSDSTSQASPQLAQAREKAKPVLERSEAAEAELEKCLVLEPGTPDLHFIIGGYFLDSGNITRALEVYCETLELDVSYLSRVLNQLKAAGVSFAELGDALDKRSDLGVGMIVLKVEPSATGKSSTKIAFINELISRREYELAEGILRKWIGSHSYLTGDAAHTSAPAAANFQLQLCQALVGLYERQKKYDAAISELKSLVTLRPQDMEIRLRLVTDLERRGKQEAAISELKSLVAANPKDAGIRLRLINTLERKGVASSTEEAESLCREAIELRLDGFTFHDRLAKLLSDKRGLKELKSADAVKARLDEAKHHYDEAIKLDPDNIEYRLEFAKWLSSNGKAGSAIEELETILAICQRPGQRAQAHVQLGDLHVANKNYAKALRHFKAAVKLEPNNAKRLYRLGQFYEATGSINSAIEAFEKAQELAPSDSRIKAAREKAHKHKAKLQQILRQKSEPK